MSTTKVEWTIERRDAVLALKAEIKASAALQLDMKQRLRGNKPLNSGTLSRSALQWEAFDNANQITALISIYAEYRGKEPILPTREDKAGWVQSHRNQVRKKYPIGPVEDDALARSTC